MFDGLDQIAWKELGYHVYGKYETIPEEIRNLLSDDEKVREGAREFLLGGGQDFGDIYDTTPHIIPFLFEILESPATADKDKLLYHLSGVAEHIASPRRLSIHMMRLGLQTYDVFKAHLDIVISLLDDSSTDVRVASLDLLQHMTDEVERLIPELIRHFGTEQEEAVQVAVLNCLKKLLNSLEWPRYELQEQYASFFEELVETPHSSYKVKAAAARASVELISPYSQKQDHILSQVSTILSEEFLKLGSPLNYMEAASQSLHAEMVAKDLSKLAPEPLVSLLQNSEIDAEQAHLVARALLASAFVYAGTKDSHWSDFPNFDKKDEGLFYVQHYSVKREMKLSYFRKTRFLQALVDADKVWEIPTNLFSFFYGLPDSRDALRSLLKDSSTS